MAEPTKPRRLRADPAPPEDVDDLRMQLAVIRAAAGVPGDLDNVAAARFLSHITGKLDRVGVLAVQWEARAAVGVTLAPDYQRGCADTYRAAITELRAALGWPEKP